MPGLAKRLRVYRKMVALGMQHGESFSFFLKELRAEGRCVIFSSHIMQEVAALCDHIVVIAKGTVVAAGSADALRAQTGHSNLEDAFVSVIGSEEGLHA